jgi:hypothetical protein
VRLTNLEKKAVLAVLLERIAGGTEDLKDALGLTEEEADRMMDLLDSAAEKLTEGGAQ